MANTEIVLESNSTAHSYCSSCIHRRCPDWGHCIWQTKWESRKTINLKESYFLLFLWPYQTTHCTWLHMNSKSITVLYIHVFAKKNCHWDTLWYDLGGKTTDSQDQLSLEQQEKTLHCLSWAEVENNLFPSKRSFRLGSWKWLFIVQKKSWTMYYICKPPWNNFLTFIKGETAIFNRCHSLPMGNHSK